MDRGSVASNEVVGSGEWWNRRRGRRMTLRLTEEQLEIRALARDFALGEIRPHAAEWDARRVLDP